jgi:DNA-binding transcriptional LysR family regulator
MGRILNAARAANGPLAWLEPVFTSHVATVLKTMAQDGRGITWSPLSLVKEELERGTLVRSGSAEWDVPMEIRLFRPRARLSQTAEQFWSMVNGARDNG